MEELQCNVHAVIPLSYSNGPGRRAAVWFQGCTLGCLGCCNDALQPIEDKMLFTPMELFRTLQKLETGIEGVSFSGGEPFLQAEALASVLRLVKTESSLSVLIFSGYTIDEIGGLQYGPEILAMTDILVAGRYNQQLQVSMPLLASSNQTVHLISERYTAKDIQDVPDAEVFITADGTAIYSGIHLSRFFSTGEECNE